MSHLKDLCRGFKGHSFVYCANNISECREESDDDDDECDGENEIANMMNLIIRMKVTVMKNDVERMRITDIMNLVIILRMIVKMNVMQKTKVTVIIIAVERMPLKLVMNRVLRMTITMMGMTIALCMQAIEL